MDLGALLVGFSLAGGAIVEDEVTVRVLPAPLLQAAVNVAKTTAAMRAFIARSLHAEMMPEGHRL